MDERKPGSGHETTDADVKPILRFLFGLAALIALVLVGMGFLFDYLESHYQRAGVEISPLIDTEQIPPGPRLQPYPAQDLARLREREDRMLNTYEWIDPNTGVFRIPIERAMELTVEMGLPVRVKSSPGSGGE